MNNFTEKVAKPKTRSLTREIASAQSDPRFFSALHMLPNPDDVLRKLGRTQDVYDAIGYDAHVTGEIRSQHGALLKREWRLIAGGEAAADIAALELCDKVFKCAPAHNLTWNNLIWNTFQAIYKGYSVAEIVWKKEGNYLVPESIMDKPNRRFGFGYENDLRVLSKDNMVLGDPVDPYKFVLTRHMPNHDNPYGFAVFSACFWPYTFKHHGFRWASKFMERYSLPSAVGKYPAGTTETDQQKLLDGLIQMIEDNAIVIPDDDAVQLLEAKPGAHVPHHEFVNLCNREISKALTSQTLGSEVTDAGSRSTGEVQQKRQSDNGEADAEMVQYSMQKIVDYICALNFPDAVFPKWQWYDEKEVSESEVKTLKLATEIVPVKTSEVYEKLQLSVPEASDEVIFTGGNPLPKGDDGENSDFNHHGHHHKFASEGKDDLSNLADQGVAKSKTSIQALLDAVYEHANKAGDLTELEDSLPDLLDSIEPEEFIRALQDTKVIANAKGIDDAS